jgi:3-oxoacyl-[acyl-carrier-protein] synthase III
MRILSIEHSVPSTRITNETVIEAVRERNRERLSPEDLATVERRILEQLAIAGTDVRYILDGKETALDHVARAGARALDAADVAPQEVDFIIYAGVGRGWLEPAMANVVQHVLGLESATGFDVLDACASWLRSLEIARAFLRSGRYRRGLIVNCECGLGDYADLDIPDVDALDQRVAAFTVGEASTATVIDDSDSEDDFYFAFRNYGEHFGLCMIPLENVQAFLPSTFQLPLTPLKFHSYSRELIGTTIKKIVELFESDRRFRQGTFDICFGHAASEKAVEIIGRRLRLEHEMYYPTHPRFGNTVAASVPLAISLALSEGRLRRGDRTLIIVGSAGISVGLASFTF